jgi:hypothetical protein
MPLPLIGTDQANLPFDGVPPFVRSRALQHWRSCDGTLTPLTRHAATLGLRASAATVYDNAGNSIAIPPAMAAWSAEDWDGDSAREELLLRLGVDEPLRFFDPVTEQLWWPVRALTVFHEFIWVADGPLWSLTNDDATGAWLHLEAKSDGTISFQHDNGTSDVESIVGSGLTVGNRCSVIGELYANGSVRARLVKNGGTESSGTLSIGLAPAANWGGGAGVKARVNEFGDALVGQQRLRTSAVFADVLTRRQLEGLL